MSRECDVITFNDILEKAGIEPSRVRLMRHQDGLADPQLTPFRLWRDDPAAFVEYQSRQSHRSYKLLANAEYWAAFVVTPQGETLFANLYRAAFVGVGQEDRQMVQQRAGVDRAGEYLLYDLHTVASLGSLSGRVVIEWGRGYLAWTQRAELREKPILELRPRYQEPQFPGFDEFLINLSDLPTIPLSWTEVLRNAQGIYLLSCPRTKEFYIGSATSMTGGFWRRWLEYYETGHGENVRLKSRETSDYQISVLEVAGSLQTREEILRIEQRWIRKLRSTEIGLNTDPQHRDLKSTGSLVSRGRKSRRL